MGAKENKVTNEVILGLPKNTRIFRNHVGQIEDKNGRVHKFGLAPGSADLIGYTTIEVTPEMVGKKVAVFTSIEVKTKEGRVSKHQKLWGGALNKNHCLHTVARCPEDVSNAIATYINDLKRCTNA